MTVLGNNTTKWIKIGRKEDIPRQGSRLVQSPQGDIALFRSADDQVFALTNECPHKKGPLVDGLVHGHRVTCPLHSWVLELESGRAVAPDEGCATRHPVKMENGLVYLGT